MVLHRGQNVPLVAGVVNRLDRISSLCSKRRNDPLCLPVSATAGGFRSTDTEKKSQICEVAHTQIACTGIILRRVGN
jgi:hypothetical protein